MKLSQWIAQNPVTSISILVIIIAITSLIYCNRKDVLLKSALYIVAKVEDEWGSKMGQVKFAEAYTYLKANYPIITFFLPEKILSNIIEDALVKFKAILNGRNKEFQEKVVNNLKKYEEKQNNSIV